MKSQTEKTKQISVANIAKEVLINIFQIVNNGIDIRFEGYRRRDYYSLYWKITHSLRIS